MVEKISFEDEETGLAKELFVLAETVLGGVSYILVTEEEEGDSDAMILKNVAGEEDAEKALYETVTDEKELKDAMNAFSDILDDVVFDEE
ncbi:MAG: DUF1292 domain-containing protein [Lachnospiraceae bacterium]|nr:DUF1292 domain-containing protein [Lachnospiraceae bacterium]MBQ9505061.1 DUF1292 domain-containing protein [Lachnospiraceae bacterium]